MMTLETALFSAVGVLSGCVGVLWRKSEMACSECKDAREKCENELREIWRYIGDRRKSVDHSGYSGIKRRRFDK